MSDKKEKQRGLGRGLSALMADIDPGTQNAERATGPAAETVLPITSIHPNPDQPRKVFGESDLRDLKRSIAERGIIQPLIVRPDPKHEGDYQIVAGERRWRAAQMAKVDTVPVLIRDLSDLEVLEIAIIENVQRADLNPIDEAAGYQQLMDRFGHTQEKLSEALGKSRSHIANTLRLLNLPDNVAQFVKTGQLSAGHARALLTAENPMMLAQEVIAKGLSVRQTESLAKTPEIRNANPSPKEPRKKDSDTVSLEADLSANLGMKVAVNHKDGSEKGSVTIHYKTLEQLDELCAMLSATRQAGSR